MSGWVVITDVPVYMRERGGGGRGECGLKRSISVVRHTQMYQSRGLGQTMPGWDVIGSESGRVKLGVKSGRGKYDVWYDWVVKALLSSYMSVGRSFAERPDMPCLAITANFTADGGGKRTGLRGGRVIFSFLKNNAQDCWHWDWNRWHP